MLFRSAFRAFVVLAMMSVLSACNAGAPQPRASAPPPAQRMAYTPSDFQMPAGSGCSGDIARWQAVQDNDKRMGQVNDTVAAEIASEIAAASAACQAGHDGEARAMVANSKRRHGYPS